MKNSFSYSSVVTALLIFSSSANALVEAVKVPEPSSLGLLGLALVIAGIVGRKK